MKFPQIGTQRISWTTGSKDTQLHRGTDRVMFYAFVKLRVLGARGSWDPSCPDLRKFHFFSLLRPLSPSWLVAVLVRIVCTHKFFWSRTDERQTKCQRVSHLGLDQLSTLLHLFCNILSKALWTKLYFFIVQHIDSKFQKSDSNVIFVYRWWYCLRVLFM